ncbi:hypothetical protein Tco_1365408 [Tanacetum coccineum]
MRDIVRLKTERELVRIKIDDGNAFWKEIRVNTGVFKLMLLSLKVNAAKLKLMPLNLMLPVQVNAVKVNGERQIQALVDKKKVIITKTSIRSDLKLDDAGGTDCLPTTIIFKELARMGAKTTAWNEFSSTMASTIICLATNQKFNLSKYIFDAMKKSRRKQRKDSALIEPTTEETPDEAHSRVLALETTKSNQALDIESLKRRVKSLEKRKNSRTPGFKRLRKVGSASKVESSNDVSLGAQEDASKQGRKIVDLDADAKEKDVGEKEVSAADPVTTAGEVVTTANVEVTTASALTITIDELTLAQNLIKIKATKPKAIITAATTTITTRPKARGVVVQEPSEFKTTSSSSQASQLLQVKDKGKAKIVKPEKPSKKKDQIALDEELALRLHVEEQAELEKKELHKKKLAEQQLLKN